MSIPVFIVDDDPIALRGAVMLVNRIPGLYVVGTETDPIVGVSKITSGLIKAQIIILDIDMPDLNGIDMSRLINEYGVVIFVTAYTSYALEAYNTDAADFLTKPLELAGLLRAVKKAKEKLIARDRIPVETDRTIFVKLSPRKMVRIKLKELIYVEVDDKYLKIHIQNGKPLLIKKTLIYAEEILPRDLFLRISKSCIVNLEKVIRLTGNQVIMDGSPVLVIGSSYMDEVYSRYDTL